MQHSEAYDGGALAVENVTGSGRVDLGDVAGPGPYFTRSNTANRSVHEPRTCPTSRSEFVCLTCGTITAGRCRRNRCPSCGPVNALLVAGAIDQARPERLATFTQVGEDWQTVRARMKRLTYDVRAAIGPVSWCWHVEPNPRGTGHHVHALQYGRFLPQRKLSAIADYQGMGSVVDVRRIQMQDRVGFYGLKLAAAAYGGKLAQVGPESLGVYLEVNGGRMVHASRGFWRTPEGERIAGIKGAVELATRAFMGGDGLCVGDRGHEWERRAA